MDENCHPVGQRGRSNVKAKTESQRVFLRNQKRFETRKAQREILKDKIAKYKRDCQTLGKTRIQLRVNEADIKKLGRTLNVGTLDFDALFEVHRKERIINFNCVLSVDQCFDTKSLIYYSYMKLFI
jgi:hypothetical protein